MAVFYRFALFFILIFLPFAVFARDIEITVEDEDLKMPLEGAVISLRDGRRFICDEDGVVLVNLPDNRHAVVQIAYPGYETKRITIPAASDAVDERITVSLRLGGVMEGRELVIEARRTETSETQSGRSVAISDRELVRTAEIGIIEDVMSSVKLLPGVGYTGMLSAMPSIRGGDPGDLMAVFDGFYLERPYHWIGAVSIFNPKMVSSAMLSHGVFSSRYGHSISGLLEITSKSPSSTETELETAISTSSASINLSLPVNGKGGILFMGNMTYWDIFVWAAKGLSRAVNSESLDTINYISTSPYIRSAAVAVNYRFNPDLDWRLNAFFGSDGVGVKVSTDYNDDGVKGLTDIIADYNNYQGFITSGITASPSPVLVIKTTGGVGFIKTVTDDYIKNNVMLYYKDKFLEKYPELTDPPFNLTNNKPYTAPDANINLELDITIFNAQARVDVDRDLGKGFIAAFGVQELYSLWVQNQKFDIFMERPFSDLPPEYAVFFPPGVDADFRKDASLIRSIKYHSDVFNQGYTTSAYSLLEYTDPGRRFGTELGLRVDHLFFKGEYFSAQTLPALNPRFNIDFNILKNRGVLDSLDLTAGTGLFSSINDIVSFIDRDWGIRNFDLKFNRSWTSIAGVRVDVAQGYSFNIEGYYKYIFNRAYLTVDNTSSDDFIPSFYFDGIGRVGGFDLQLQKLESRYWDGWISYTFTWAKYYDPNNARVEGVDMDFFQIEGGKWYYPSFHRFHNCSIVLNYKPSIRFNIATRFGFASGQLGEKTAFDKKIYTYPVVYIDENGKHTIIQKYRRDKLYSYKERVPWSLPWDLKFSFFRFNSKGRVGTEIYLALENLMSLFYNPQLGGNTRFNEYTGKEDPSVIEGGYFDFPIPMVSFGLKWRY